MDVDFKKQLKRALLVTTIICSGFTLTGCGTIGNNLKGQIQNIGTGTVNKWSCESVKDGIWEEKNSSRGGYSTNGGSYKGSAGGSTSGRCLTGQDAERYIQKKMVFDVAQAQISIRSQATVNKTLCDSFANSGDTSCKSVYSIGRDFEKSVKYVKSSEQLQKKTGRYLRASDTYSACLESNAKPVSCLSQHTRQLRGDSIETNKTNQNAQAQQKSGGLGIISLRDAGAEKRSTMSASEIAALNVTACEKTRARDCKSEHQSIGAQVARVGDLQLTARYNEDSIFYREKISHNNSAQNEQAQTKALINKLNN